MPNLENWSLIKKRGIQSLTKWIENYAVTPLIKANNSLIKETLNKLALDGFDKLYSPYTSTLFFDESVPQEKKIIQDISLILYLHHLEVISIETLDIPFDFRAFINNSTLELKAGTLDLSQIHITPISTSLSLDVCNYTLGQSNNQTWISRDDLTTEHAAKELNLVFKHYNELLTRLNKHDHWSKWTTHITSIIVPLYSSNKGYISGSYKHTLASIGVEFSDSPIYNFKILVHESAHLYFHTAELFEELVTPNHSAEYWSPVKLCPRPLRMVLLAYHALVFMGQLLNDLELINPIYIEELNEYKKRIIKSRDILEKTRLYLTDNGKFILDLTNKEADTLF